MSPIKTAVVGVGVQGERHAEKFAAVPSSQLVGVVDIDIGRAHAVADALGVEAMQAFDDLGNEVEAVVIATPTSSHFVFTKNDYNISNLPAPAGLQLLCH